MKIYFVIPFFSDAKLLHEALLSLRAQTYAHWSAVVLDDSIDPKQALSARESVESLQDPRIAYSKNPQNIGMSKNMNRGLELGIQLGFDGVCILHADDTLDPEYAKSMAQTLSDHPEATALFCETKIIDGKSKDRFSFPDWYKKTLLPKKMNNLITLSGADGIQKLIPGNFIFFPTVCYATQKMGEERFNENFKMVPDFDLFLRILLKNETLIGLYSKPLYYYRRHENNSTNLYNKNLTRFKEERDLYLNLARNLDQKGLTTLAESARRLKIVKLNLLFNAAKSLVQFDLKSCLNFLRFLVKET